MTARTTDTETEERERYGEAIMTAIADDGATPPVEKGTRVRSE